MKLGSRNCLKKFTRRRFNFLDLASQIWYNGTMKLIIAGSRTFNLPVSFIDQVIDLVDRFPTIIVCGCGSVDEVEAGKLHHENKIVSDKGVDRTGEMWAKANGLSINYCPAKWKKIGRVAGPKRNTEMANYGDALLLIWDGSSRGSADMKKKMQMRNKPIYEVIIRKSQ